MNGSLAANRELVEGILAGAPDSDRVELLVCPPFPYLASVQSMVEGSRVNVGAQTVSEHVSGAYTGEVSASMLKDLGIGSVLVGHSERRSLYGESNEDVAQKFVAAQATGLRPVLCVGESLEERENNETEQVVEKQLAAVIDAAGIDAFKHAVVAYEPVWAIGTGLTATPEQAQSVHAFIRSRFAGESADIAAGLQILYGGSCKGSNAEGLFSMPDIDGGLIGGASLKAEDFLAIADVAAAL